jgi:tetratricopeptide (TPR) repeat protein
MSSILALWKPMLWCKNVQPKVCSGLLDQVDKLGLREHRASLYLQVKRLSDAEEAYRKLLDVNPDNYQYDSFIQMISTFKCTLHFSSHTLSLSLSLSKIQNQEMYRIIYIFIYQINAVFQKGTHFLYGSEGY